MYMVSVTGFWNWGPSLSLVLSGVRDLVRYLCYHLSDSLSFSCLIFVPSWVVF